MIWVDADATPRAVKEILFRIADRTGVDVILVANQPLTVPRSPHIQMRVVGKGFDVADDYIAEHVQQGHLVITADIPLAAAAVAKGAVCVDPRGDVIDASNAEARLARRNVLEMLRETGAIQGGPPAFSDRDKRRFAAVLDKWLATGQV